MSDAAAAEIPAEGKYQFPTVSLLNTGRLHVRRSKRGTPSVHPMRGDEIRALRRLQREQEASPYVFTSERGGPMSAKSFGTLFERLGRRAGMPFTIFPHMLRHWQRAGKMWRIGLIAHEQLKHYDVLFDELRQLGYVEGHNIIVERRYAQGSAERFEEFAVIVERRYAQGSAERFEEFAAEMVRLRADLIIVNTSPAAIAVKKVTTTTPIVIPTAIDPVGAGDSLRGAQRKTSGAAQGGDPRALPDGGAVE